MKKRIWIVLISLLSIICIAFGVSACSKDNSQGDTGGGNTNTEQGSENTQQHTHKYSTVWSSSATQHWHECKVCQDKTDIENHTAGAAATENTAQTCTVCGYILAEPIRHSHSPVLTPAKSATCTESGNIAYYVCSCGTWFSDGNATTEIIDHNSVILKATGHSYSSLWTYNDTQHWHAATCEHTSESSGIANHTFENDVCSVCRYERPQTVVEITAIYLNKTTLSLYVDDSETLVETILPVNATESVTWISTAPSVATVENGTVTAVSTGTATIIVSSPSGKTATCEVTITENTYGCTFKKFGNGYAVVGYTGSATTVTVPSTYQGEPVVAIGTVTNLAYGFVPDGFAYCSNIESVIIPSSVTTINPYAFYNCTSLKELIIPDSVSYLGYNMLYNCNRLQKLSLSFANFKLYQLFDYLPLNATNSSAVPSSLKELIITGGSTIAVEAFESCSNLTSVTIGDGVKSIGEYAFWYCNSLTSVTIGNGVTSIGDGAFSTCRSLTSITIPDSVTSIGEYAFVSCGSLTSVTIGNSVTSIGFYAFNNCYELTSVVFENPNGWRRSSSSSGSSGTAITGLDNPATAATYLKDTYCNYYWKRS